MNEKKNLTTEETFALAVQNHKKNNLQVAENLYNETLKTNPNYAGAHNNLGIVLNELGEYQKAMSSYEKAIQINPNHVDAHNNLGLAFYKLREFQKAISCHKKAIQLDPNNLNSHNNLGILFYQLGQFQNAKSYFEKAIQIDPNHPDVNFSFGMLLLSMSDFKNGLIKYEWRKKLPININKLKNIKGLEWQGENLNNKTILILSEQGIGDIIQFSRYIYLIEKEYSANIIIKIDKKIAHLFSKSKFKLIFNEDNIPKYDFYKHLMSLPKIYYEKTKTFPSQINFIPKDKKITLKWKERLNEIKGFKVGINWQGRKTYGVDHLRSIPLNYFNDLFNIEKINFISLQKGFGLEQIKNFKHKDKLYNFSKEVDNGENIFEDTIGILQNIDLVISIDSSLVHLSSTLGIKTFALLHFCPDWRWNLMTKEFSWYDNLKIYRQEEVNKWDSIFSLLKKDLVASLGNSKHNIN